MDTPLTLRALLIGIALVACCSSATPEVEAPAGDRLDVVGVDKLQMIVRRSPYTFLLLTENDTVITEAESMLVKLKSQLEEDLKSPVMRLRDSTEMKKQYNIDKLPSILFFRQSNAIIFDGPFDVNYAAEWISQNLQSSVTTLHDDSFEHLTQAATGATTGDWFVLFCNWTERSCQSLQPVWETVASRLKSRLNVAYVDTDKNEGLVKRFKLEKTPSLIFFRLGKMYQYINEDKQDVSSFTGFALGWYKNVKAETIPQLPTPFDNLIDSIVQKVQKELEDPYVVPSIVMLCLPFSIVLAAVIAKGRNYKTKYE